MPSNLERLARRKRQTRLTFDPVDEKASPANKKSPARVRYQQAGHQPPKQTGTPSSSFQIIIDDDDSEDILSSGHKTAHTPTRRTSGRNKNTTVPARALPTPVKSSQAIGMFARPNYRPTQYLKIVWHIQKGLMGEIRPFFWGQKALAVIRDAWSSFCNMYTLAECAKLFEIMEGYITDISEMNPHLY